jgi:type III pantothenate kinase
MNLCLDIGNTSIKLALFEKNVMSDFQRIAYSDQIQPLEVQNLIQNYLKSCESSKKIKRAIASTVTEEGQKLIKDLKTQLPYIIEFTSQTKIPIKNLYQTAGTLGSDRLPPVIAAREQYPDSDILVIDAGTCIKYNFLNRAGEYLGGAIAPGLTMRFKALHTFTSRLPLMQPDENFDKLVGNSTRESILAGVQTACLAEMNELINYYQQTYPGIMVFLTGGDMGFFEKRLKNRIFADPYLVLKGLNSILNYE